MPISDYERASVQRRIVIVREHICTLGIEELSPLERANNLRSALAELLQLEELLIFSDSQRATGA